MSTKRFKITSLILAALLLLTSLPALAEDLPKFQGQVIDNNHQPVIGASVLIFDNDDYLTGGSTDSIGHFEITLTKISNANLTWKISAIGFESSTGKIPEFNASPVAKIVLDAKQIEVGGIEVTPDEQPDAISVSVTYPEIQHRAQQSLIATNPVAALKEPEINHQGSQHSSQIRINGTSPHYYFNGALLGSDPDHYGMFTIVPSSAIEQMKFYPQGTDASLGLPSVIELNSPKPFKLHRQGELNLSTIEATGMYSIGDERYFVSGTLRKSVLDKLVKQFDISTERKTLPPTNFQDVFVGSGFKLSPHHRVFFDHYRTRDFLSYQTGEVSGDENNVSTFQQSYERFYLARLQSTYENFLLDLNLAHRESNEAYDAVPPYSERKEKVSLNLDESKRTNLVRLETKYFMNRFELTLGYQWEYMYAHEIKLSQQNWNFLPPFYNSDNPYIYQEALNQCYGSFLQNDRQTHTASYLSGLSRYRSFTLETGVRLEYFDFLKSPRHLVFRNRLDYSFNADNHIGLYFGTFVESPTSNILEPYQVLIHDNLRYLHPIKTRLWSLDWRFHRVKVGLFTKDISDMPLITPDFAQVYDKSGQLDEDFLKMQSVGEAQFYGGSVSIDQIHLLDSRLSLSGSYAYTHARKIDRGVTIPYELNSPHKIYLSAEYRFSCVVHLGSEFQMRSGYPYSPTRTSATYQEPDRYSFEYYNTEMSKENSEQFPTNLSLSLYGGFAFSNVEIYFSVSNITNHANPVINAASGYIYDAGILPMIGLKWRF